MRIWLIACIEVWNFLLAARVMAFNKIFDQLQLDPSDRRNMNLIEQFLSELTQITSYYREGQFSMTLFNVSTEKIIFHFLGHFWYVDFVPASTDDDSLGRPLKKSSHE